MQTQRPANLNGEFANFSVSVRTVFQTVGGMRQNFQFSSVQFSSQSLHQTADHNPRSSLSDDVHQHDDDRPSLFDPAVE